MNAVTTLPIHRWPRADRPFAKLLDHGPAALTDSELLATILGSPARSETIDLARKLLDRFESVRGIARAGLAELVEMPGLGETRALRLQAALGLAERLGEPVAPRPSRFRSAHEVYLAMRDALVRLEVEVFLVLLLDGKGRRFATRVVSQGSLTASLVHPREVFSLAIRERAAALIVAHNHPSGSPQPSPEDLEITRRLRQVGELVGIRVVDHVIVAEEGYASLAELGWP